MTTKVKGLLKGLRYISQMFDEKEPEMQIGFPTDVKHVAHIGWDGPSANTPSWMNEYKSSSEVSSGPLNSLEELKNLSTNPPSEETSQSGRSKQRSRRSSNDGGSSKHSKRQSSSNTGSPLSSPRGPDVPKPSRRHRSSNKSIDATSQDSSGSSRTRQHQNSGVGAESPARDSSDSSRTRRHRNSSVGAESPVHDSSVTSRTRRHRNSSVGADSTAGEQPSIPKHSRGRKSKGSSRSEDQNSSKDTFPSAEGSECVHRTKNTASHLTSVLEAYEEER